MIDKLKDLKKRFLTVEEELSKPETTNDLKKYTSLNKEYKTLGKIVKKYKEYSSTITGIEEAKKIIETEKDLEFKEIAKKELEKLNKKKTLRRRGVKGFINP